MSKTIDIELYVDERDFIVELVYYALQNDLLNKLKKSNPNKEGVIELSLDEFDLEALIGTLSLETNHNKKASIQERACELAERLETYESLLK